MAIETCLPGSKPAFSIARVRISSAASLFGRRGSPISSLRRRHQSVSPASESSSSRAAAVNPDHRVQRLRKIARQPVQARPGNPETRGCGRRCKPPERILTMGSGSTALRCPLESAPERYGQSHRHRTSHRARNAQDRVGAQAGFPRRAIEFDQAAINLNAWLSALIPIKAGAICALPRSKRRRAHPCRGSEPRLHRRSSAHASCHCRWTRRTESWLHPGSSQTAPLRQTGSDCPASPKLRAPASMLFS